MTMNLDDLRALFPVTKNLIYLNHSGTGPISTRVRDAMAAEMEDVLQLGAAGLPKWYRKCEEFKERLGALIGAEADEIAITLNTSEGINIVAQGLNWRAGDNVVFPDTEYPANVYPWMNLERQGVEVRMVPEAEGSYPVEHLMSYTNERTRVVAVSHVQFASGYRIDLEKLGSVCRERGIFLVVDAIQSLGALPVDAKSMKVDFLSGSTYKWMLGPQGVGFFFIDRAVLDKVHPTWVGSDSMVNPEDYLNYDFTFAPGAKRFEPGTYSTIGVAGALAAVDLILEQGIGFIQDRILALTNIVREGAETKGWKVYSPWGAGERSGIVSIYKPGVDPESTRQHLLKNKILTTVRAGRLRLAPHYYLSEDEVHKVIELLP